MANPVTMMGASMAMTAIGSGISAVGTIAGGSASETAGRMKQIAANAQAEQETENSAGELAAAQRRMLDTRMKTQLTQGSLLAKAAGSGFNAATGSMLEDTGEIAQRGEYQALMDVFQGENARTGLLNKAKATRYGGAVEAYAGEQARDASYLAAAGTIAGGAGSMLRTYGAYTYPQAARTAG
jgi:hypothetical protein